MSSGQEKLLLANCYGKCCKCRTDLVVISENYAFIGELCHIEAEKEKGPRHNPNLDDYEVYDNLIFLCCNCHRMVDKNTEKWTPEELKRMRNEHEEWVKTQPMKLSYKELLKRYLDYLEERVKQAESDAYWVHEQYLRLSDTKTEKARKKQKKYYHEAGTTERIMSYQEDEEGG